MPMAAEVGQDLDLQCFHHIEEEEEVADKAAQWLEWQEQAIDFLACARQNQLLRPKWLDFAHICVPFLIASLYY